MASGSKLATTTDGSLLAKPPDAAAQAVLDELHPLLVPVPPSWMPQAPGWFFLATLTMLLVAWSARRIWHRWQAARYRRMALAELQRLRINLRSANANDGNRTAIARHVPELVRRLALAHATRTEVASLQGEAWSLWLDRSLPGETQPFTRGVGRNLAAWAYLPDTALPWNELDELLALVERWIRYHRVTRMES
jgi:hypothetical protein